MVPTLRDGDAVLALRGRRPPRPGDVVLARFRSRPDLLVIKRVVRVDGTGWWLVGDNPYASDDSSRLGVADVIARVVLRYWPSIRRL
jgi:phage repressor protein C with HTH and peptisase S24 domain